MKKAVPDKVCYEYRCPRYPKCKRARGKGCCIEQDAKEEQVKPGECGEENGYKLFM